MSRNANNSSYFSCKERTTCIDQFIIPGLVMRQSCIRICSKIVKLWHPKLQVPIFTKKCMTAGNACPLACISLKKMAVQYFQEIPTNSYETSPIY